MSFNAWMKAQPTLIAEDDEQNRAILAWWRIQQKPTIVSFRDAAGTTLAAQTVRIESDNRASIAQAASGRAPKRQGIIFGIKNHPDLSDTVIKEGYTFNYQRDRYSVVDVIDTIPGEIQAIFEASR